jgi:hypothetical protein
MGKGRRQNSQGKIGITSNGVASTRGEEHDGHQIHDYIYTLIHVYTQGCMTIHGRYITIHEYISE